MSALEASESVIEAIKGLTRAQRRALDAVANGVLWWSHEKVIKALVDKGLIVDTHRDMLGLLRYALPINVHIAWTELVSRGER